MEVKCVPLKVPGKYWDMEPPRGAPGLIEICINHIVWSDTELSVGEEVEVELKTGISIMFGHSYWIPSNPEWLKLL